MRYGKDQKQATRQRILEAAGRRFKQDGIDGAGVAAVMSDAGLTNGAFYAHFASKEDLVANVLADQLRAQRQSLDAQPADRAGLEAFIRSYLSPEHRDQAADGCPSAALLDEIARRPAATRQVFTDELIGRDRRHRLAPGPDRSRGRPGGRAHGPRADGRHAAARQGTDRPRPLRSASRPGRGDGVEDARRLRSLAARTRRNASRLAAPGAGISIEGPAGVRVLRPAPRRGRSASCRSPGLCRDRRPRRDRRSHRPRRLTTSVPAENDRNPRPQALGTRLSVQSALVKPSGVKVVDDVVLGACPGPLVVIQRQWRCSVTRRAARRAERVALDGRRAGRYLWVCARGRPCLSWSTTLCVWWAGDMMVMG